MELQKLERDLWSVESNYKVVNTILHCVVIIFGDVSSCVDINNEEENNHIPNSNSNSAG